MSEQMNRVERARTHINVYDFPLYGYILLQIDLIETESVRTGATNGHCIKFNPSFIETLTNTQIKTFLIHEVRHIIYCHHLRREGRNFQKWNEATDYAINYEIVYEDHLPIIDNILLDIEYKDMSAEMIFRLRKEEENEKEGMDQRDGEGVEEGEEDNRGMGEVEEGEENRGNEGGGKDDEGGGEREDNRGMEGETEDEESRGEGEDSRGMEGKVVDGEGEVEEDGDNDRGVGGEDTDTRNTETHPTNSGEDGGEEEEGTDTATDANTTGSTSDNTSDRDPKYVGLGDIEDAPPESNPTEEESRVREMLSQAIEYAEHAGNLPASLKREMTKRLKPEIPWERLLVEWLDTKANEDYTFLERDTRIDDFYFPALAEEGLGLVVLAIDVSYSVSMELYTKFITEMENLRKQYSFDTLVLACNREITFEKKFLKTQPLKTDEIVGGGGTAFSPVFKRVKELGERPVGLIYFTDLCCSDFGDAPYYDVLWLNWGREREVPFGRVIDMK